MVRLRNLMLVYLPSLIILGILLYYYNFDLQDLIWISLITSINFVTASYIQNQMKKKVKIIVYIIPALLLGGLGYLLYEGDIFKENLLNLILVTQIVFIALLLHNNWISTQLFLGKIYSNKEIQKFRTGSKRRIKEMNLDEDTLIQTIQNFNTYTREKLEADGYLKKAPEKGLGIIAKKHRTEKGELLLTQAKDVFYALLYGDDELNVDLNRIEDELLSIIIPRLKAYALQPFMAGVTEIGGRGVWNDPDKVSSDVRADNVILEVEYGELTSEMVGNGIKSCLLLINNLEINEIILYFRMVNIEQSTLY